MAKRRWHPWVRYPRTTQELRANQDRNDPLVRGRRKNLPTSYDDLFIHHQKSWKSGRKQQHREETNYGWYTFDYDIFDNQARMVAMNIMRKLDKLGCFYEHTRRGVRWFGPADPC